jgi:NTE family protein
VNDLLRSGAEEAMPFGSEGPEAGVGLALSGGGFRAALFHAGVLWRLAEMGKLSGLARISSVSGGSITAALLGLRWERLRARGFSAAALEEEVIRPLRAFCARTMDVPAVLSGALLPFTSIAGRVEAAYADRRLLGQATLQDLPEAPRFVLNATNLATGVGFRFSRPYAGDYRIGLLPRPAFRLARAVAASSAFPPILSPVVLETDPGAFQRTPGADLWEEERLRRRILLTDGGVYDNLGLETVWKRHTTVIASDAGEPLSHAWSEGRDWLRQGLRVISVLQRQALALRRGELVARFRTGALEGAYLGIGTPMRPGAPPGALPVPPEVTERLSRIRTRLDAFSGAERCALLNWGYARCDASVRTYLWKDAAPPAGWPCPEHPLDRGLGREVRVEGEAAR